MKRGRSEANRPRPASDGPLEFFFFFFGVSVRFAASKHAQRGAQHAGQYTVQPAHERGRQQRESRAVLVPPQPSCWLTLPENATWARRTLLVGSRWATPGRPRGTAARLHTSWPHSPRSGRNSSGERLVDADSKKKRGGLLGLTIAAAFFSRFVWHTRDAHAGH